MLRICPHCGAENPDDSSFCGLCLACFGDGAAEPASGGVAAAGGGEPVKQAYVAPSDFRGYMQQSGSDRDARGEPMPGTTINTGTGPSPGAVAEAAYGGSISDYHSLPREQKEVSRKTLSSRRIAAYDAQTASFIAPSLSGRRRSTGVAALLILKHSFIMFLVLLGTQFLVSMLAAAIAGHSLMEGSESGIWLGQLLLVVSELAVIILAGYRTAAEAMERGRGWMYGAACVAAMIFIWQALFLIFLSLVFNAFVLLNIFQPVFLLIAVFLYLPMGALGGWAAEKRYMG
jgi:hypothetical protein